MIAIPVLELVISVVSILVTLIVFFVRIEHRLTMLETMLKMHLQFTHGCSKESLGGENDS